MMQYAIYPSRVVLVAMVSLSDNRGYKIVQKILFAVSIRGNDGKCGSTAISAVYRSTWKSTVNFLFQRYILIYLVDDILASV